MSTSSYSLIDPQSASELLLYRLSKVTASAGSLVVRLCEGGHGITRREWAVLMWLQQHPHLPPSELAQRLSLDRARTSRAISSLLDKKLITREPVPGDKRQARLCLTEQGHALYAALFPPVRRINQALLRGMDAEALDALNRALDQLQRNADWLVADHEHLPRTYRMRGGARRGRRSGPV
ncbi:MarR family winged helix-turn-helix transcriptional regulator [Acidovorax sp. 106]|uniref:MarR family winged helix-turn-helix transcriptional regulator n=1 Tax=Acidovorax sp. 106 TaxID=2135637 RepID=UPI000F282892|nr:MarR family transcriptional regulator [Acidovorax sp. 106]RLJ37290.1 DNA-binding MarR family transcriptional regulator [Acidovorax sp. 106]